MKTATLVRTLDADPERNGVKALYRMEPPHEGHEYVVASGSIRNTTDHAKAMGEAGYEIVGTP